MKTLVLLRHGESDWNRENRFTGWTDVDLSAKGVQEALSAGDEMKKAGYGFDVAYTSALKRAIKTLNLALERMDLLWIPVYKSWRLNESITARCRDWTKPRPRRFMEWSRPTSGVAVMTFRLAARPRRPSQSGQRPAIRRAQTRRNSR